MLLASAALVPRNSALTFTSTFLPSKQINLQAYFLIIQKHLENELHLTGWGAGKLRKRKIQTEERMYPIMWSAQQFWENLKSNITY